MIISSKFANCPHKISCIAEFFELDFSLVICYAETMPKEAPLQFEMFTGELVDNRTSRQKRRAKQHHQPQQIEMFSQREIAQFGVRARPKMPLATSTKLVLVNEDPRTPEEKARDQRRRVEAQTHQMFGEQFNGVPAINELLDQETQARLLDLHTAEKQGIDALAQVRFFEPGSTHTWYASGFDGEAAFFGLVIGDEIEMDRFVLPELEFAQDQRLLIERDLSFVPRSLREVLALHENDLNDEQDDGE